MSQRSTRAAIKRTFSVDNIDINAQSQSVSLENLIAGKPNGDYVVVNSKKRRKQKSTQSQNNQVSLSQPQPQLGTSALEVAQTMSDTDTGTELPRSNEIVNTPVKTSDECSTDEYLKEIHALKSLVTKLQTKLSFVLSFLGIADDAATLCGPSDINAVDTISQTVLCPSNHDMTCTSLVQGSSQVTSDGTINSSQPSRVTGTYADVARKPTTLSAPLKQAVVSAVYADLQDKDRRAKNIVISGLPITSMSDKLSVESLCRTEFGFSPHIVRCRRLGQVRVDQIQPVLVVLQSATDAAGSSSIMQSHYVSRATLR